MHAGAVVPRLVGRHDQRLARRGVALERQARPLDPLRDTGVSAVERRHRRGIVEPAGDAGPRANRRALGERRERVLRAGADRHRTDAIAVDEREAAEERRRGPDVRDLAGRDLRLTRLTLAGAEAGEVEHEGGVAGVGEPAGVGRRHLLLHREPGADDDHDWPPLVERRRGTEEAAGERHTLTGEDDRSFVDHARHRRTSSRLELKGEPWPTARAPPPGLADCDGGRAHGRRNRADGAGPARRRRPDPLRRRDAQRPPARRGRRGPRDPRARRRVRRGEARRPAHLRRSTGRTGCVSAAPTSHSTWRR